MLIATKEENGGLVEASHPEVLSGYIIVNWVSSSLALFKLFFNSEFDSHCVIDNLFFLYFQVC